MRSPTLFICLALALVVDGLGCSSRWPAVAPAKLGGQAVKSTAPRATQAASSTTTQAQNPPPGSFDWAGFPETGGGAYQPLPPAQFDPNDHSGDDVTTSKYPLDSPARPAANEDGSEPQVETDEDGKQWAVYTTRRPSNGHVLIQGLTLNPTKINGQTALFGGVTVSNLTAYNIVGLQLVYVSGNTKTTVLKADRANVMINGAIASHTGVTLQVKSVVVDEPDTTPSLLLEAQIDGPPGFLIDDAPLKEVLLDRLGQPINPPRHGF